MVLYVQLKFLHHNLLGRYEPDPKLGQIKINGWTQS